MNIFAKGKKKIILRREDLVKNTRLPSKELSKLFLGNTHFFEHYLLCFSLATTGVSHCTKQEDGNDKYFPEKGSKGKIYSTMFIESFTYQ
jgi:hypothetical protein